MLPFRTKFNMACYTCQRVDGGNWKLADHYSGKPWGGLSRTMPCGAAVETATVAWHTLYAVGNCLSAAATLSAHRAHRVTQAHKLPFPKASIGSTHRKFRPMAQSSVPCCQQC